MFKLNKKIVTYQNNYLSKIHIFITIGNLNEKKNMVSIL